MSDRTIAIGVRLVGAGQPAYIVAEIGINHNGDMSLARRTIEAAKQAGADAVKFQNYRTDDFVPTSDLTFTYVSQGRTITENQRDMFLRHELAREDLQELAAHCIRVGIDFHSTPTNAQGMADLVALGVGVLKNGSDFLSHLPLIKAMARTGLPTVLSTGMAELSDIQESVDAFRRVGGERLILLHCVSQYPAPIDELNLRRIPALAEKFGCPVGFSDHSEGSLAAAIAVALGACWVEKHFTISHDLPGPDHAFSADPRQMANLVERVRTAETMLGSGLYGEVSGDERKSRQAYRLSCAAARDLHEGTIIAVDDIAFFRPGDGFPPAQRGYFVGRRLMRAVARGTILRQEFIE